MNARIVRNSAMASDPRVANIVRNGRIRLALFLPQYVNDHASGGLRGLGTGFVALAFVRAMAERLGIAMEVLELATPPLAVACVKTGGCEVAFLGFEPSRAAQVDFSPPVFQFDYTYLVPAGSAIRSVTDVDRGGIRIAIVESHASALALKRLAKHATLVGTELPDTAFALLRDGHADAFALPRDQLIDYARELPGSRVLDDAYGINHVGIAVAKGQPARLAYVSECVAEAKASGLVQRAIEDGSLHGFQVSP